MNRVYEPNDNLFIGVQNIFPLEIAPWDEYFMAMAQTDFKLGRAELFASKSYFIRKAPFGGSYALLGGITEFIRTILHFNFKDKAVQDCLKDQGYCNEFSEYLKKKESLNLKVFSPFEGSVFFPHEPIVVVEGDLLSVRIAEGILTKAVNFPTLAMTKWHRCKMAASPGLLLEFARRRAQNADKTSLYAYLGGADLTSNTEIRRAFDIPSKGTMGHEWVQSIGNEFDAFDLWLEHNPDKPVLLVDTINTLDSGMPNAIKAFKKHKHRLDIKKIGIRLDSGDLAYLAMCARKIFDENEFFDAWIYMTNDLDEYSITEIKKQIKEHSSSPIESHHTISKLVWAAGTKPGTCYDQPSIGGVMKLTSIVENGKEKNVIKLARDNPVKCSIQGSNRVYWITKDEKIICSVIAHKDELGTDIVIHPDDHSKSIDLRKIKGHDIVPRNTKYIAYRDGNSWELSYPLLSEVRNRVKREISLLHWTHKRLKNPHMMKVGLTPRVFEERQRMIESGLLKN